MRTAIALLTASLLAPLPAAAQDGGLTFEQVQRKYRGMAEVHILKCDRDGDRVFGRAEMGCVRGIYQAMYIED
jgi:hypothetical protein